MEIESVKNRILDIHEVWDSLDESLCFFKCGEIHESYVIDIISHYCIDKGYNVDGFPMEKRILGLSNANYNEDYFCNERYVKYLDILATKYDDVFELMYFFNSTFWLDQIYDEDQYKEQLLEYISCNIYEIDF